MLEIITQNIRRSLIFISSIAVLVLPGCNENSDRPEVVDTIRPLGVATTPVNAKPGDNVTFALHVAAPKGSSLTAASYQTQTAIGSVPMPEVSITVDPQSTTSYASLDYMVFTGSFTVPTDLSTLTTTDKPVRLRFGMKLQSQAQEIPLTADIMIYPAGSSELDWQPLTVALTSPTADSPVNTGDKVSLSATVSKAQEEPVKFGWFIGGGEIKNRRATSTDWKIKTPGTYTIAFTARGKKSHSFAIVIQDVVVQ